MEAGNNLSPAVGATCPIIIAWDKVPRLIAMEILV